MGRRLMERVIDEWAPDLSENALRVLIVMARRSLDTPSERGQPAARYFGGWGPLAAALRPPGPCKDPAKSIEERVRKAVKELVAVGAITRLVQHARDGERQTYGLDALLRARAESPNAELGLGAPTLDWGSDEQSPNAEAGQEPQRTVGSSPNAGLGPRRDRGTTERNHSVPTGAGQVTGGRGSGDAAADDEQTNEQPDRPGKPQPKPRADEQTRRAAMTNLRGSVAAAKRGERDE